MAESPVVGRLRSEARAPTLEERRERLSGRFRSVGATADALRAEVRAVADWRRLARRHPAWVLATAAGAGLLAAGLLRRGRRRREERDAGVGAPFFRGALSVLAGVLVRRFGRRLRAELRRRPRLVPAPRGAA